MTYSYNRPHRFGVLIGKNLADLLKAAAENKISDNSEYATQPVNLSIGERPDKLVDNPRLSL